MQEQLEANQRAMAEMEKSWEQKLSEAKAREAEEDKIRKEEEASMNSGSPHLVNLNEDPMLDRKVVYNIKPELPLICGRRGRDCLHKLQLGGTGIQRDHCRFETDADGNTKVVPLNELAMPHIRINGKPITSMEGVVLKPNDRICIGPSAFFLFKNKDKEAEASMPDTDEDPISFDSAADEVANADEEKKKESEQMKKAQEEAAAASMAEMEAKFASEKAQADADMKAKQAEAEAAAGDEKAKLEAELNKQKEAQQAQEVNRAKQMLAEGIRQKALQAEYQRVEKSLNELLPLVNEANLAAAELGREVRFNTRLVKMLDPFLKDGQMSSGKTQVLVKVDNGEEKYYYEWQPEKFQNRLFMIRELLEEYFDTGVKPNLNKNEDPFWDPPNPILIGQSFLQLEPLGVCFENHLEATILSIDGKGGKQGMVSIGYEPCNSVGELGEEFVDEKFLVEDVEELLGEKDLFFKVFIKNAKNLPKSLCRNPFVTYQFKFDKQVYQTEECNGSSNSPVWNYENVHKIDEITPQICDELKNGSVSFMVYAYPPVAGGAEVVVNDGGAAALKRKKTMAGGATTVDPDLEAKVLGLPEPEVAVVEKESPKKQISQETSLKRKATL